MHGQWARFIVLLLRDLLVLALCLVAWHFYRPMAPGGLGSVAAAIGVALLTVFVGYLVHEWGHLLGAWFSGSGFELPASPFETFFLFRFDAARSSRPQFFAMALGGFASSVLMVALLAAVLPRGLLASWIALALTALGVLATFIIEVPEFMRVARGGPIPNGAAFVQHPGGDAPIL
jgi:hypothetical protein